MKKLPLWVHIALGIILGFSLLAIGWTYTVAYIAKKEVEEFNQQVEAANERARQDLKLLQAQKKAKAEAKARAEEQARLLALAEMKERAKNQKLIEDRRHEFNKWYEDNMPEECRPNYQMSEVTSDFVECINHKMRAEREFNQSYSM